MKWAALLGPLIVLLLWQGTVSLGVLNPFFFPPPSSVLQETLRLLVYGGILRDIGLTLWRTVLGFAISVVIGVPIGLLMGSSRRVSDALNFLVDFLRSIPGTAMIPLFIFLFGVGDKARIALGAFAATLIIVINSMYGVAHANPIRLMAARTMKVSRMRMFFQVILPDALPEIFVGLRLGLSICIVLVIVSEMFLGTAVGLGHRIYDAQLVYRVEEMYSSIIFAGILGYAVNRVAVFAERRIVHWAGK